MANQQWVMKEPGVGFTKNPFVNFSIRTFMILQKYMLYFLNHIYIWQVSPELSCGNTCQILMWYSTANICCDNAENNRTEDNWLSFLYITTSPYASPTLWCYFLLQQLVPAREHQWPDLNWDEFVSLPRPFEAFYPLSRKLQTAGGRNRGFFNTEMPYHQHKHSH